MQEAQPSDTWAVLPPVLGTVQGAVLTHGLLSSASCSDIAGWVSPWEAGRREAQDVPHTLSWLWVLPCPRGSLVPEAVANMSLVACQ